MSLGLRSFIVVSVAVHAAVLGGVALSSFGTRSMRSGPATLTLRSNARPAAAVSKPSQKPTAPKANRAKVVQKMVPVMRPDAVSEILPEQEEPEPEIGTNLGAVESPESAAGASLEREAQLVAGSLTKPEYTSEALKARLQGLFAVDIHLSDKGNVLEIELVQAPGHGMDERIVAALRGAMYLPKRDARGNLLETWITIQFRLEIP